MDTKKARRKTFDVEYVVVSGDNVEEVAAWCNGKVGDEGSGCFVQIADKNAFNARQTKAFIGDYVLKSGTSFKAYGKKAFEKSFDEIFKPGDEMLASEITMTTEEAEYKEVARSAETGQFVSQEEAEENPDTTVVEKVTFTQKGSGARTTIDPNEIPPIPGNAFNSSPTPDALSDDFVLRTFDTSPTPQTETPPVEDLRGL